MSHTREWKLLNIWLRMASWIGDGAAQRWFASWRAALPGWDSLFYLPLDAYVIEGGWELTSAGGRSELTFPVAYQLVDAAVAHAESAQAAHTTSGGAEPLAVMVPHDESCQWCGRRMTVLLDLDLWHETLAFLRLKGSRLRLVMCEECSLWNHLYMDVDLEGNTRWSAHNPPDADIPSNDGEMFFTPPTHRLVLGVPCSSLVEVAASGDSPDVSQLGGFPAWVLDAEYRQCPSCHQRMMFVGQVMPDMITDRAIDGLLYGLLWPACLCSTFV